MRSDFEKILATLRLYNSDLIFPASSIYDVVTAHLGIQSQIESAAALSIGLRTANVTIKDFLETSNRLEIIRTWGIRTTKHIYTYDDWKIMLSHISNDDNWYRKKMHNENRNIDELVHEAKQIIEKYNYFDKRKLIEEGLNPQDLGSWGDLLIELTLRGYIFQPIGQHNQYGNVKNIFGNCFNIPKLTDEMKKELLLRYLYTYGPATIKDFAHWRGIKIYDAKKYFELSKYDIDEFYISDKLYYVRKYFSLPDNMMNIIGQRINCIILPKFDPLLVAYSDKSWLVSKENQSRIWGKAGHIAGVIIQYGEAVATWKYTLRNNHIDFEIYPFSSKFSIQLVSEEFRKVENFFQKERGIISVK